VQSSTWNRTKKALWKQLHSTEKIRKLATNVRQALHKEVIHKPLSTVTAPGPNFTRQEYHSEAELEKACLAEAGRCFTQAQNTPLLSLPLLEIFSKCGNQKATNQVLAGQFTLPPGCNRYTTRFLVAVSCPQNVTEVIPQSLASYSQEWNKLQEATSSLASGIHFGHYMAGMFNPEILVMNVAMEDIPLHTGFTYDRWKKGFECYDREDSRGLQCRKTPHYPSVQSRL